MITYPRPIPSRLITNRLIAPLATLLLLAACNDPAPADAITDATVPLADVTPDATDPIPDALPDPTDALPDATPLPPIAAANALPPDHPLALGQHRFVYETWGAELSHEWPPATFMLALMQTEPEVFGDQFAAFGFIPNPDDDFPFGLTRGTHDPEHIYQTCALCHIARLPDDRIWLGAPNTHLDFARFRLEIDARATAAGHPPLLTELQRTKAAQLGPGRSNAESADYPQVVPADFPPYFRLATRSHLNHLGTGRDVKTEAYLSLYTFGPGNPDDQTAIAPFPSEAMTRPFIAYLGQIEPPTPPPGDPTLILRGRQVFTQARCDTCHHPDAPAEDTVTPIDNTDAGRDRHPGDDPAWPRGSIHTSPLHRVLIDGDGQGGGLDQEQIRLITFIARHTLRVAATDGYRVPPLTALWLTAPYLHNGSVPTLEALLQPASDRPTTFDRDGFVFDTTLPGNDNRGHEFGVDLPPEDKNALVAWLRRL